MEYVSTRAQAAPRGFLAAAMTGLAEDGGLFVPAAWPQLTAAEQQALAPAGWVDIATDTVARFTAPDLSAAQVRPLITQAAAAFQHAAVTPLVQVGDRLWLMELFHGPTLAFKDVALQWLGGLFDHVLEHQDRRVTVVGATSGDTGSAAMAACAGRAKVDCFILYPHGRTSEVQRRQMTTVDDPHIHALAVEGTFDDCQDLVKAMFNDPGFRAEAGLTAVNSINWARIIAQVAYYVVASLRLGGAAGGLPVRFAVPTGNFGNVLAGDVARQMGLPIGDLIIGTNRNDILTRFFETAEMTLAPVEPSLSPSMDIQVSSNFERALFELFGRDGARTATVLSGFRQSGGFAVTAQELARVRARFRAHRCDDATTLATIARIHGESGIVIDPHTAVGVRAALNELEADGDDDGRATQGPVVALACAHPAKFPDAVARALGAPPPVPHAVAALADRDERITVVPADLAAVQQVIRARARAFGHG